MSYAAIQALQWLRRCNDGDQFTLGQASGVSIILMGRMSEWEACYVENIKRQYLQGGRA
jgi:hypothetical protein